MDRVVVHIGVKQAYCKRSRFDGAKSWREILPNFVLRVANSINDSEVWLLLENRDSLYFSFETMTAVRECKLGFSPV